MSKESGSGLGVLAVGAAIGFGVANWMDAPRYPVGYEYSLIDSCVSSSRAYLNTYQLIAKKNTCVCALEKTMVDVGYEESQKNWEKFSARFGTAQQQCQAS